jgi:hypothetical protein
MPVLLLLTGIPLGAGRSSGDSLLFDDKSFSARDVNFVLRLTSVAALMAAVASALLAQPRPGGVNLPAIQRITDEARQRSRIAELAHHLTDVYGPRLTGSPHLRAAADYIRQQLVGWNLRNVSYERWGPFGPGWTNDRLVTLALVPQAYPLAAIPKAWTPGTSGEVIAEVVLAPVERDSDFDKYRGRLRGKFILTLPSRNTPARLPRPPTFSADELAALERPEAPPGRPPTSELDAGRAEFDRKRMKFYVDEQVAALLEPSPAPDAVIVGDGRLRDDAAFAGGGRYPWPEAVPLQLVVAGEHYNRIARTLEKQTAVTLEMNVVNAFHPAEPDSFNIVADIPGTDRSAEIVMLGAHLDSWHAATGATDNAAGCAVLIEAMRILQATGLELRRTVRLALWTGSEQGQLGSRAYVAEHFADPATMALKGEHQRLAAYFNMDGGTGLIRGLYLQGNERVAPIFAGWMTPFSRTGVTALSPRHAPTSDHVSFDAVGLPAFHFLQDPLEYESRTRHSNLDVYDRLQIPALIENAAFVASMIYHTANHDQLLPRKPLPAAAGR